jgi:hypothetical protein
MQMSSTPSSWPRKYFEAGGGDPYLFYVVYGDIDPNATLSGSKYRCQGIPDGLKVQAYGPNVNPEVCTKFRDGLLWEELKNGNPDFASVIQSQSTCIILSGTFRDPSTLDYLRDTVGLITHFLDNGGVAVFDPQTFKWWSPCEWRSEIFDPASPVPLRHAIVLISEDENGLEWIHTRGLRKFGRPDISFPRVEAEFRNGAIELCNRFIEFQAYGGVIAEGQAIKMKSLPTGLRCFHHGGLDDPSFNNFHVTIE